MESQLQHEGGEVESTEHILQNRDRANDSFGD